MNDTKIKRLNRVIAIDFDGTCVEKNHDPEVGPDNPTAVWGLRQLLDRGYSLALWTCRAENHGLPQAIQWFADRGIPLEYANENPRVGRLSPKINVFRYIDDKAIGCPLMNGMVDWPKVIAILDEESPNA